jgi:hypothetical protein
MPLLGAFLALMIRSIFLQIRGSRPAHDALPPSPTIATNTPTPAKVH